MLEGRLNFSFDLSIVFVESAGTMCQSCRFVLNDNLIRSFCLLRVFYKVARPGIPIGLLLFRVQMTIMNRTNTSTTKQTWYSFLYNVLNCTFGKWIAPVGLLSSFQCIRRMLSCKLPALHGLVTPGDLPLCIDVQLNIHNLIPHFTFYI